MKAADMKPVQTILFLAFPKVSEQDLLAPWELIRSLAWTMAQHGEKLEVTLGSFEGGDIATHMGARIGTDRISSDDRFDLIYIPGGIGAGEASKNPAVLDLVRAHHAEGRWVAANCAGLSVLHRAGILGGVEVTAPATVSRRLTLLGTTVASPRRAWKINPQKKLFTAGGAGTVHPSTIALVWHLFGKEYATDLASTWDTLPLHGDALFALDGPQMKDDAQVLARLQDNWERVFLPD
jgi:putative intracellular protease/amidase